MFVEFRVLVLLKLLVLVPLGLVPAPWFVSMLVLKLVELLVPVLVLYWSPVPPLLQPASANAAQRIRIDFFIVYFCC